MAAPASPTGSSPLEHAADGRFERIEHAGLWIWTHVAPGGTIDSLDAEVAGALEHDQRCGARLRHPVPPDVRYPVVWPHGTTIAAAAPLTLALPDGATVSVGDPVSGGGGYAQPAIAETYDRDCLTDGDLAVFNNGAPIEVT